MKPKRLTVPLTAEQHQLLEKAAQNLGLTLAAYVRLAALEKARREGEK